MQSVQVVSVGSANIDLVVRVPRFPAPGETLTGGSFQTFPGGKGANQAVAAGKLGQSCALVGRVGADRFGDQLFDSLRSNGVATDWLHRDEKEPTGTALITIDESGQNTIVVAPGSNGALSGSDVEQALGEIDARVILAQLEIPLEAVLAASVAGQNEIFILNPAPARTLPGELLERVDYLTPNETETHILTGIMPVDDETCQQAARILLDKGVKNILFTLGEHGSFLANEHGGRHFASIKVKPVDTTAAGDAFNGAFAHFLANGYEVDEAIRLANIAGALSTTKPGAQASMPSLGEVLNCPAPRNG